MYRQDDAFTKIRPTKLNFYVRCMEELGFSADDLLSGTGLSKDGLKDRYALVEIPDYIRVVSNMMALTRMPELAFELGNALRPADLGILGHAITTCNNAAHGFQVWQQYNWLFFGSFFSSIETLGDNTASYEFVPRVKLLPHLLQFFLEEKLIIEGKLFRQFNNCTIRIRAFSATYGPPPHARLYQKILPAGNIHFNAARIVFVQDRDDAYENKPFDGADPESHEVCIRYLDEISNTVYTHTTLAAKIRHQIDKHLPRSFSLDDMAALLKLSRRTLCRKLLEERTSYQALLSEVRESTAKNLLVTTRMSVDEIGAHIGFENTASFRRAFKQWTGVTIGDYRQQSRSLF
ncbi:MAG: AraC family transcriptional regulator ligand-binding domain-containing protein [Porticoccaceae bacterium]